MEQVQLQPVAGTHGDQFEARVGGSAVGVVGWRQLLDLTVEQFAKNVPSSISLKDGPCLVVYEQRTPLGVAGSADALRLEIGQEHIQLSEQAAHDLARVLLAYAGLENQRGQWLIRVESGQR